MTEQEIYLLVGDLAGRVGYPTPSIHLTDAEAGGLYACLQPRGGIGPVMHVRSDVGEIPTALLQFLVGHELIGVRLGVPRHRVWLRIGGGVGLFALVFVTDLLLDLQPFLVWGLTTVVAAGIWTAAGAVWCRWIQRRVDRRLIEVLGRESTVEGLRHLAGAQEAFRGTRWLLSGAPPLPNTRLAWLGAAPVRP